MKRFALPCLLSLALLIGTLAAGAWTHVTNSPPVPTASAVPMSPDPISFECEGGVKASCRRCHGMNCVLACEGDYACGFTYKGGKKSSCRHWDRCVSYKPVPRYAGGYAYVR